MIFLGEYEFKKASEQSGAFLMKRRKKEKHHTQEASAQAPVRYDGSASVDGFIIVVRCPFVKPFCILIRIKMLLSSNTSFNFVISAFSMNIFFISMFIPT